MLYVTITITYLACIDIEIEKRFRPCCEAFVFSRFRLFQERPECHRYLSLRGFPMRITPQYSK